MFGPKYDSARYNIKSNIPFNNIDESIGNYEFTFNAGQGSEAIEGSDVLNKYNFLCVDPIFNSTYLFSNGKASLKYNNSKSNSKCPTRYTYYSNLSLMNILTSNKNYQLDFKNVFKIDSEFRSCITICDKTNEKMLTSLGYLISRVRDYDEGKCTEYLK